MMFLLKYVCMENLDELNAVRTNMSISKLEMKVIDLLQDAPLNKNGMYLHCKSACFINWSSGQRTKVFDFKSIFLSKSKLITDVY